MALLITTETNSSHALPTFAILSWPFFFSWLTFRVRFTPQKNPQTASALSHTSSVVFVNSWKYSYTRSFSEFDNVHHASRPHYQHRSYPRSTTSCLRDSAQHLRYSCCKIAGKSARRLLHFVCSSEDLNTHEARTSLGPFRFSGPQQELTYVASEIGALILVFDPDH
jgi:hypothetical protein